MKQTLMIFFMMTPGLICWSLGDSFSSAISGDTAVLHANIRNCMEVNHIPGLVATIVHGDTELWKNAFGVRDRERQLPMNDSTVFWLASLSKTITSAALMQLKENGLADLDEDVSNYLPFQVQNPFYPVPPVTARRLVTHTAALADDWPLLSSMTTFGYDSPIPLEEFLENYFNPSGAYYDPAHFQQYPAGTAYSYCNTGMGMTGDLVGEVMGVDFRTWCADSIFFPLGMTTASWTLAATDTVKKAFGYGNSGGQFIRYNHTGRPDYPAGWLNASIGELSLFFRAIIRYGELGGVRILDSATVAEMLTVQFPSLPSWNGRRWGLGMYECQMAGRTLWGHWGHGWGHTHDMYFDRNSEIGVIVLSNGDSEAGVDSIMAMLFDYAEEIISDVYPPVIPENPLLIFFPNPFSDRLNIRITGTSSAYLLSIRTTDGRLIRTMMLNGDVPAEWNGRDENGNRISEGIYLLTLTDPCGKIFRTAKVLKKTWLY